MKKIQQNTQKLLAILFFTSIAFSCKEINDPIFNDVITLKETTSNLKDDTSPLGCKTYKISTFYEKTNLCSGPFGGTYEIAYKDCKQQKQFIGITSPVPGDSASVSICALENSIVKLTDISEFYCFKSKIELIDICK